MSHIDLQQTIDTLNRFIAKLEREAREVKFAHSIEVVRLKKEIKRFSRENTKLNKEVSDLFRVKKWCDDLSLDYALLQEEHNKIKASQNGNTMANDFTCPDMRDACNGETCPQFEACEHLTTKTTL